MQYRKIGNSNLEGSVIALGAWAIGGWMWGGTEEKGSIAAIHAALDHGINLIDTAPAYGFGRSEEIVGRALAGRRNKVIIATKCGLVWDKADWPAGKGVLHFYSDDKGATASSEGTYRVYKYLRAGSIIAEVDASLRRLGTEHIDILQTHWQDESTPLDETLDALLTLKKQGKIVTIGCSNATADQVRQYVAAGLDVDQEKFSLLDRDLDKSGRFDLCRDGGVSFFAYSPLANGLLTGKLTTDRKYGDGDLRHTRPRFKPDNIVRTNAMLDRLRPIADAHGLNIGQLVIAWTVGKYAKMHALCGIRSAEQAAENATAGSVTLSAVEASDIERIAAEASLV